MYALLNPPGYCPRSLKGNHTEDDHPRGVVAQMLKTEKDVHADRTVPTLRDADISQ